MQSALDKIKSALLSPEVKKTSKEQIKEKVKPSILARLERNKELAKQENEARRSEHRSHKNRIWSVKALAIFDLRMTGAFSILGG